MARTHFCNPVTTNRGQNIARGAGLPGRPQPFTRHAAIAIEQIMLDRDRDLDAAEADQLADPASACVDDDEIIFV